MLNQPRNLGRDTITLENSNSITSTTGSLEALESSTSVLQAKSASDSQQFLAGSPMTDSDQIEEIVEDEDDFHDPTLNAFKVSLEANATQAYLDSLTSEGRQTEEANQVTTPPSEQDGHWKQAKSQRHRKFTSKNTNGSLGEGITGILAETGSILSIYKACQLDMRFSFLEGRFACHAWTVSILEPYADLLLSDMNVSGDLALLVEALCSELMLLHCVLKDTEGSCLSP
ncbi:hypothetical protein Nepgr_006630 [Nepenthes gracilis]|uniref:Uncharacterized protein n=1 Tax=Nepenthes gracilis TaxID=150966 RepID=A0AAD3S5U0_NEPGR|nr:hypothetical protein Nepgr_006630 [Nepenthes gracilis]